MPTLIYLHGFLSSPLSKKAQQSKLWLAQHFPRWHYACPDLSPHPAQAKITVERALEGITGPKYLIGSSLGGFWSTWAIEQGLAHKAVLVNPAVKPHLRFRALVGETLQHYYSEECYTMSEEDLQELENCYLESLKNQDRYWVLLQAADEVLDYRHAEKYYAGCRQHIEQGGDHSFVDFDKHLPAIMQFFEA